MAEERKDALSEWATAGQAQSKLVLGLAEEAQQADFWEKAEKEYNKITGEGPTKPISPEYKPLRTQIAPRNKPLSPEVEEDLPQLPPTIARFASPEIKKALRRQLAQGSIVGDREKNLYMSRQYLRNKAFRDKVEFDYEAGNLGEPARRRVEYARRLREVLTEATPEGTPEKDLSEYADDILAETYGVGPNRKLHVSTIRDPRSGQLAIDVSTTFRDLQDYYTRDALDNRGLSFTTSSTEVMKEITQDAYDRASRDIMSVGQRMRNSLYYDKNLPVVEELAALSPWERQSKAFMRRKVGSDDTAWLSRKIGLPEDTFGVFNPTVEELAKEGTLSWTLRMSPFDAQAVKMKLIREHLTNNGKDIMSMDDAALYAFAYLSPITSAHLSPLKALGVDVPDSTQAVLEDLGITPEEEVEAYLRMYWHLDEGRAAQGEISAIIAGLLGASKEEQLAMRDTVTDSAWSAVAPFVSYFADPDAITVATVGAGKSISMMGRARHMLKFRGVARTLRTVADDDSIDVIAALAKLESKDEAYTSVIKQGLESSIEQKIGTIQSLDNDLHIHRQNYRDSILELKEKAPQALEEVPSNRGSLEAEKAHLVEAEKVATSEADVASKAWRKADTKLQQTKKGALPTTRPQTGLEMEEIGEGLVELTSAEIRAARQAEKAPAAAIAEATIPPDVKVGDTIEIFDATGKPYSAKVTGISEQSGQLRIINEAGEEVLLNQHVSATTKNARSPDFEIETPGSGHQGKKVKDLTDEELASASDRLSKQLARKAEKGEWAPTPIEIAGKVETLNAIKIEQKARKGAPLGGGLTFKVEEDVLQIRTAEVPEALRGQGIGQELYLRTMEYAKEKGFGFSSDIAPSPEAIAAYERMIESGVPLTRKMVEGDDGKMVQQFTMAADELQKTDFAAIRASEKAAAEKQIPLLHSVVTRETASPEIAKLWDEADELLESAKQAITKREKAKKANKDFDASLEVHGPLRGFEAYGFNREFRIKDLVALREAAKEDPEIFRILDQIIAAKSQEVARLEFEVAEVAKTLMNMHKDYRKQRGIRRGINQAVEKLKHLEAQVAVENNRNIPFREYSKLALRHKEEIAPRLEAAKKYRDDTARALALKNEISRLKKQLKPGDDRYAGMSADQIARQRKNIQTKINEHKESGKDLGSVFKLSKQKLEKAAEEAMADLSEISRESSTVLRQLRMSHGARATWLERQHEVTKLLNQREQVRSKLREHEALDPAEYSRLAKSAYPFDQDWFQSVLDLTYPGTLGVRTEASASLREVSEFVRMPAAEVAKALKTWEESTGFSAHADAEKVIRNKVEILDRDIAEARASRNRVGIMQEDLRKSHRARLETATGLEKASLEHELAGMITKEDLKLFRKILHDTETEGKKLQRGQEAFVGEENLSRMEDAYDALNARAWQLAKRGVNARRELESALSKAYAADPKKLKEALQLRKKSVPSGKPGTVERKAVSLSQAINAHHEPVIKKLFKTNKAIREAKKAATWRKIFRETSDELFKSGKALNKSASFRSGLSPRTGLIAIDKNKEIAERIIAKEIIEIGQDTGPGYKATERYTEAGTEVNIGTDNHISISAFLDADTPNILEVQKTVVPAKIKNSTEEARAVAELFDYARRNNYSLLIDQAGNDLRYRLQAAGVSFTAGKAKKKVTITTKAGEEKQVERMVPFWKADAELLKGLNPDHILENLKHNSTILAIKAVDSEGVRLQDKLNERFGKQAVDETIKRMGGRDSLFGQILRDMSGKPILITLRDAKELQDVTAHTLAHWAERLSPESQSIHLALLMEEASKGMWTQKKGLSGTLGRFINRWLWQFDPELARLGMASKDQFRIVRAGENFLDQLNDEFGVIQRLTKDSKAYVANTYRYLDGSAPISMPRSQTTIMNRGPKTLFERTKDYVIRDKGRKYPKGAQTEAFIVENTNPSVLGISRMWIPKGRAVSGYKHVDGVTGKVVPNEAAQLYAAAARHFKTASIQSYEQLSKAMAASTNEILKLGTKKLPDGAEVFNVDSRLPRVHTFGAKAIFWGAMSHDIADVARKVAGGRILPEEAIDLKNLVMGNYTAVKDIDNTFSTMRALGIPVTAPKAQVFFRGISTQTWDSLKHLVVLSADESGNAVFALNTAREQLLKNLTGDIKALDAIKPAESNSALSFAWNAARGYMLLLRTAATRGYLMRNEGHIQFQMAGDGAQMWYEPSIGGKKATQVFFQNQVMAQPVVGPALQDFLSNTSKRFGEKFPILRSLTETIYNPHLADFWAGRPFLLRVGKDGPIYSGKQLQKAFLEGGVLDTQVSSDLVREATKLAKGSSWYRKIVKKIPDKVVQYDKMIERSVVAMQQRQRVGSAIIFMDSGHSLDEAIRMVQKGIYDWKHGISQAELGYHLQQFPWYRWMRLAFGQFSRTFLDGLSKPSMKKVAEAMGGQTYFNKLRQMYRAQEQLLPIIMGSKSPEELHAEQNEMDALAIAYAPNWQNETYPRLSITTADRADIKRFADDGREITHWSNIGPPNSMVDVAKIAMSFPILMASIILYAQGEHAAATDLRLKGTEQLTGMLYPGVRDLIEPYLGVSSHHPELPGQYSRVTATQAKMIDSMGGQIWRDPETDAPYANSTWKTLFVTIPPFMYSIQRLIDSAYTRNPAAGEDVGEWIAHAVGNYTRWYRSYGFSVHKEAARQRRKGSTQLSALKRKGELYKDVR